MLQNCWVNNITTIWEVSHIPFMIYVVKLKLAMDFCKYQCHSVMSVEIRVIRFM